MCRLLPFLIFMLLFAGGLALAQDDAPPQTPQDSALALYEYLLFGDLNDPAPFRALVCDDFLFSAESLAELGVLREGAAIDFTDVTFTLTETSEDGRRATVEIDGQIAAGDWAIEIPLDAMPMVLEGNWRACPDVERPLTVVSPQDAALTPEDARQAAVEFYAAFYTGDLDTVTALTCAAHDRRNFDAARTAPTFGGQILNSPWDFDLIEDGFDLVVQTNGALSVQLSNGEVVTVDDRDDFAAPRLVRSDGWKVCSAYRPEEAVLEQFLRLYFGDTPESQFLQVACDEHFMAIGAASRGFALTIDEIRFAPSIFEDIDPSDDRAMFVNLEPTVIIAGGEFISAGRELGRSAQLVREGNQWRWCSLPIEAAISATATAEANLQATNEAGGQ